MLNILVVDDDRTCLNVLADFLKRWNYRDPRDALCILRAQTIKFDLIVADVHMPELNGIELQRLIHREFQVPVILMSAEEKASNLCEGSQSGASFFILKPISTKDLEPLCNYWKQWKKKLAMGKNIISDYSYNNDNVDDVSNRLYENNSKRKLRIIDNNDNYDYGKYIVMKGESSGTKKSKVVWTADLHGRFLKALEFLGPQKSVPKKILEVMNVPTLKMENIASHLQKYRLYQKWLEAEHNSNTFDRPKSKKMWSSSFLSNEALLGYCQSKLLTSPVSPPGGITSGGLTSRTYSSQMLQSPNFYIGSRQKVYHTFDLRSNSVSPTFDTAIPEQPYESADLSNVFLDGSTYQSTDVNKNQDHNVGNFFGDALLVNKDMPNADKVHTNLHENNGKEVNSADNIGTSSFEAIGNLPSDDNQMEINDDILAFLLADVHKDENYF